MELSQELKDTLSKQLPGMFATEMQGFIQRANADAAEVVTLNSRLVSLRQEIDTIRADLAAHRPLAEREAAVSKRESDAQIKELELLKREAQIEAKIAQAELMGVKDTQKLFLANSIIRTSVQESTHAVLPGHNPTNGGYSTMPMATPVTNSTTTTTEQA